MTPIFTFSLIASGVFCFFWFVGNCISLMAKPTEEQYKGVGDLVVYLPWNFLVGVFITIFSMLVAKNLLAGE